MLAGLLSVEAEPAPAATPRSVPQVMPTQGPGLAGTAENAATDEDVTMPVLLPESADIQPQPPGRDQSRPDGPAGLPPEAMAGQGAEPDTHQPPGLEASSAPGQVFPIDPQRAPADAPAIPPRPDLPVAAEVPLAASVPIGALPAEPAPPAPGGLEAGRSPYTVPSTADLKPRPPAGPQQAAPLDQAPRSAAATSEATPASASAAQSAPPTGGSRSHASAEASVGPGGERSLAVKPGPASAPAEALAADPMALEVAPPDQVEPPRAARAQPDPQSVAARPGANTPPAAQLEVHLAGAAQGRIERMVVQLEPLDLGRVEIRLEFSDDGKVNALIAADRPETLEALQRDAAGLERTLRDAGLRPDAGGLSFSLRRDPGQGGAQHGRPGDPATMGRRVAVEAPGEAAHGPLRHSLRLLDIQA